MRSHLKDTNEKYFEHMFHAFKYGIYLILAGIACIIHAIIPNIFVTTASKTMQSIINDIAQRKEKS